MQASAPRSSFPSSWTPRRVILVTLTIVAVAAAFFLLSRFSSVLFIVFVAAVLGTAFRPAVLWMGRHGVPQRLGITLMYLTLMLVVGAVVGVLIPLLVNQGGALVKSLPQYYHDLRETLINSGSLILRNIAVRLPGTLNVSPTPAAAAQTDNGALITQAVSIIRGASWTLFGTISVFLITFFWVLDRDQILRSLLLILPLDQRPQATKLWEEIETKVGGYIRGTGVLCLSIGVLSAIAYFLIGVPSALVISVLAGVLEAVPYVGPFLTAAIAVIVTLSQAPDKIIWVIAACILIQQAENAVLVPRIMDKAVGVNAIVTLLAIAAFGSLLGILGAILAIPLAAVIQVLLDHWVLNVDTVLPAIEGRDRVAALRYQAQDLAQDLRDRLRSDEAPDDDDEFEEQVETLVGDLDQFLVQIAPQPMLIEVTNMETRA